MHSSAVAQVGGTSTCKFWWKHDMIAALVFYFALLSRVSDAIPSDCQEKWFMQRLDHFHWQKGSQPTFPQRYIVCDRANWTTAQPKGPIFFYCGNEGPLEGYINATGLMFENAASFGALIMFAEHRYYGKTQPFGPHSWKVDPSYLTSEQAMADFSTLLWSVKQDWGAQNSPVVAFGGSYGGMLAAWMRRKYPHIITGAVAASAPVGQFPGVPGFNPSTFWDIVTRDATSAAGAAPDCADNVRAAFSQLLAAGASAEGRQQLQQSFRLCDPVAEQEQAKDLAYWVQGAFDAFAMGNYHFPSSYMTGHTKPLPAFPMRAACQLMTNIQPSAPPTPSVEGQTSRRSAQLTSSRRLAAEDVKQHLAPAALHGQSRGDPRRGAAAAEDPHRIHNTAGDAGDTDLLQRLGRAAALLYNVSGDLSCFKLELSGPAAGNAGPWDYQVCTEFLGQELPYFPAGPQSMFWDQGPFNWDQIEQHCQQTWGVTPTKYWSVTEHGGLDWRFTSNIVFSNGLLDPWSAFGVMSNVTDSVVAVTISDGAHHSDLMYGRPEDSAELKAARVTIMQHVLAWVQQHKDGTPQ